MADSTEVTRANLALLHHETEALLRTVEAMDSPALQQPSLCAGWSRAHVVAHVARNADALVNMVRWAVDGRERAAYTSEEDRERDIEEGAAASVEDLREDVRRTAEQFQDEAQQLLGPAGETTVRTRTGTPVTGAQVVGMRLVEVVFHHVDMDAGYSFQDADADWVARTLRRGARQWSRKDDRLDLSLVPDDGEPLEVGGGGQQVHGTSGQLLLWLARGVRKGLRSDGPLPAPPPWA